MNRPRNGPTGFVASPPATRRRLGGAGQGGRPQGAPLAILLRDAAATDPKARSVLEEIDQARMIRMRDNARALMATGDVRPGLSLAEVTDVLFTVSSAEMYELLVIRRGWTPRRFARFQRETMAGALLMPASTPPKGPVSTSPAAEGQLAQKTQVRP